MVKRHKNDSMTLREFASRMQVNPVTVRNWLKRGIVPGAEYHPAGDFGGPYWEIPAEALKMTKPRRGGADGENKKFKLSIEEFRNMILDGKTQEEIGRAAGVTRERVRQLYNKHLRAEFGVGWVRRISLNDELRERKREDDVKKKPKLVMLKRILDTVGMKFEPVAGQFGWLAHPSRVIINGYKCKLYWCKTASPTHERSSHLYYRANGAGDSVEWADFLIMMCGHQGEMSFVLPRELVRTTYPSYRTIMHVPAERYEVYNNQHPKLPWWDYYEAWSQLDGENVEASEAEKIPYAEAPQDIVEETPADPVYLQDELKSSHKIQYKLVVLFTNKIEGDVAPPVDMWITNKLFYTYKDLLDAAFRYRDRKGSEYQLFYMTIRDKDPSSIMLWPFGKDFYGEHIYRGPGPYSRGTKIEISESVSGSIADCKVVESPGSSDQLDASNNGHRRSLDQHEISSGSSEDSFAGFVRITDDYPPQADHSIQQ